MCNETIFGKVFLGGSKSIGRLPDKVVGMLDSFIESGEHFLIGDCHGADLALQNYLHSKNYPHGFGKLRRAGACRSKTPFLPWL